MNFELVKNSMDDSLKKFLRFHSIKYNLFDHYPVYTVEEAKLHTGHIDGLHCKNLFLKDNKRKIFYLFSFPATKLVKINQLRKKVRAKNLTFASEDELQSKMNLKPGSVSPFGLINDIQGEIKYFVDKEILNAELVCFHPNINSQTMQLQNNDFQKFLSTLKNETIILE